MHQPGVLQTLRNLADKHSILLIFDEIFTGFGRTGTLFAMQQAGVEPDIVTLSKALTGGVLPLSAAVASTKVFNAFWSDDPQAALMHGPTYMANPLGCAAANASLDLFEDGSWQAQVAAISDQLRAGLAPCRGLPGVVDVRVLGAIGAVEVDKTVDLKRVASLCQEADCFIRPFGRIVYLTPAYIITDAELARLCAAIVQSLS
jgi:adenosylmethionine-8-amino-7-oxononanoate aminotransferase